MLETLRTLHKPEKIFETAGNPLLVLCNDFRNYVCKHSAHSSKLVNEIVGSYFAGCWKLRTPKICLIEVQKEHVPNHLQGIHFAKPCFGSQFISASKEIDATVLPMFDDPTFKKKIANKNDFLMIALFDMWLSNEDRNHNNSNLMIDISSTDQFYLTIFDHDAIFNSNSLHRGVFQINDFDSLIYSQLANKLFSKGPALVNIVDNLVEKFYLYAQLCKENIDELILLFPPEWGVNGEDYKNQLLDNIFDPQWLKACETNFRTIIQANIK